LESENWPSCLVLLAFRDSSGYRSDRRPFLSLFASFANERISKVRNRIVCWISLGMQLTLRIICFVENYPKKHFCPDPGHFPKTSSINIPPALGTERFQAISEMYFWASSPYPIGSFSESFDPSRLLSRFLPDCIES
jgi:hypothetical protein